MPTTQGSVQTQHASKYLQQLCKHFAHKVEVSYTATDGTAALPVGKARLFANQSLLSVEIDLIDDTMRDRAHMIIDSHLEKFAFREKITALIWDAT